MTTKWIRIVSLSAIATVACLAGANSARADHYHHGHNHGCSPNVGYPVYGYRPIQTLPYYGYAGNGYGGYSSNYGGYNNFSGGYGVGGYPIGSSYGGGAFPLGGSYGGGGFPSGASYGGGAFPRGGSYGGGGFSLYIGR